jgi:hypothetical protein
MELTGNLGNIDNLNLSIEGEISDDLGNKATFDSTNTSNIALIVDNVSTVITYTPPEEGKHKYGFVNMFMVSDDTKVYSKELFEHLKGLIDDTIANNCGTGANSNNVECYYEIRFENIIPTIKDENGETQNVGLTYAKDDVINIRIKLAKYQEAENFTMTYQGLSFACSKDGDMYANCRHVVGNENVGLGLNLESEATPVSDTSTIVIDKDGQDRSLLVGLPNIAVEGYLNGVFTLEAIEDLIDNGANYYNTLFHITFYAKDKAGNINDDTRIIHFIDNTSGGVAAHTEGVSYTNIAQGVSFTLPKITANLIKGSLGGEVSKLEDYTLEYRLDGRVVSEIDTSYAGRYEIYLKAVVDGEEVKSLIHTLDIESTYVEILNTDANYMILVMFVIFIVSIFTFVIFISKKKRLI